MTAQVHTAELSELAARIAQHARAFSGVRPASLSVCGVAGSARVEQALEAFGARWQRYLDACEAEVEYMGQLVALAAEAYEKNDGTVAASSATSAALKVGSR